MEPFLDLQHKLIENSQIQSHLYNAFKTDQTVSVSGCGDCLATGIIIGISKGWKESNCLSLGLQSALLSLKLFQTVQDSLKLFSKMENDY